MAIVMGTAGHIDHGKTSLVRALTGTDCDRLDEEKRRGITIELRFAFFPLPNGERMGVVDVPWHERFVRNMVAGAAGIDFVLLVIAAEDVGLAYPQAIPIVKACVDSALQLGLPEARLPLADAAVLMATAPKSNSAHNAILAAEQDLRLGKTGPVPRQLQNKHFDGEDAAQKGQNYLYPHDYPGHWVKQQYLPDALAGVRYYEYGQNKNEQAAKAYWDKIKK